jgi:hypothetical protein
MKIKQSSRNTNKHTEVGMELLGKSVSKYGVLESISVSDTGEIISGNGRKEIFDKQGLTAVEIHLKENEYPVIVTSIKSDTKEFYEAQIIANTTSEKNYNLDTELVDVLVEEFDIDVEELGVEVEDVDFEKDYSDKNKEIDTDSFDDKMILKLQFNESDYHIVKDKLLHLASTPEQAIFKLLGLTENE